MDRYSCHASSATVPPDRSRPPREVAGGGPSNAWVYDRKIALAGPASAPTHRMQPLPKSSTPRTAVFTIVSANYLHYARVLMQSVEAVSPSSARFVLLADRLDQREPGRENFTLVQTGELPLPDANRFSFRYTILEFNTAVKPWFFRKLFEEGYDHVVYLDPDTYLYAPAPGSESGPRCWCPGRPGASSDRPDSR